jgi:hypothetical protein
LRAFEIFSHYYDGHDSGKKLDTNVIFWTIFAKAIIKIR